jgi:hypothetical protein
MLHGSKSYSIRMGGGAAVVYRNSIRLIKVLNASNSLQVFNSIINENISIILKGTFYV